MQAVILAAGMGRRLGELTSSNTKCMVKVNGVTLIERMLRQIEPLHLSRIVIVIGYEGKKLVDYISTLNVKTPVVYVENPIYYKTNNIYSLALASQFLYEDDTLLFESDLIFEDSVLEALMEDPRETLALVDKYESWMDGTCVKLGDDDSIEAFIPKSNFKFSEIASYYKTVNIYKFSLHFSRTHYIPFLKAYQEALGLNEYYEQVLRLITMLDYPEIKAKRLSGQKWYEIDNIQDLDIAESIFTNDDRERLSRIHYRWGGFWRYPGLMDFCYLVTPFYPPQMLKDEITANFDILLSSYPSGMNVNSLLAAKNFNVHRENIIVGNGAAELIKLLIENFITGSAGFIRPSFEEYVNRYPRESSVMFTPGNKDFSYTAEDVINFFSGKSIKSLFIVNPDNPSGNYINKDGMTRLLSWAKDSGITLVIDESFSDFADEPDNTLIKQNILDANPGLYVIKSISKSHGVPGLRLGVMASGNQEAIAQMKKDIAIWNINSFAEFYMQIAEKYEKDFVLALEFFRTERARFFRELAKIPGIRPVSSQANYIMAEISGGVDSSSLTEALLSHHNILIRDLRVKTGGSYVRLAIRTPGENDTLLEALRGIMEGIS